ncbi:hypothetical protein FDECE_9791 [Fusarium decemcellulare]|nr:hypothetical protein FDECE_9791 [Fusarium decemcellulare]
MTSPSEQTLLVTGANGFLAGHIIKEALNRGYHVRGTVRSEASAEKVRSLFADHGSKLSVAIVPDFTAESFKPAFTGTDKPITGVMSIAAPFILKVEDNARDLLDPAIKGATAVLEGTKRFGSDVRRVVNTSSFASILDMNQGYRPGYTYTEEDWNPMDYDEASTAPNAVAYCASKALAEKAMWDWVKREQPYFSLAQINPPWVFGPHVGGVSDLQRLNESSAALYRLLGAKEVPAIDFAGFADVRVVATAHLEAFERPEAGGQRFLVGQPFNYQNAVDAIRQDFPELRSRIPKGTPGGGKTAEVYKPNGQKAERVLGIKYLPLDECLKDCFVELLEAGA